ncbi:MAG: hypothetical protein IKU29_06260 [Parabacteroides sp.]|nr:hypothetical protein [Parabacteroides sp.]
MTQEDKELLLKDLCSRLPYGVKVQAFRRHSEEDPTVVGYPYTLDFIMMSIMFKDNIEEYKPYLFPLSSITDEQKKEISKRYNYYNLYQSHVEITNHSEGYWDTDNSCNLHDYLWLEDWFNKNHFDYRGLIPKGLAIDATGLNIY